MRVLDFFVSKKWEPGVTNFPQNVPVKER